MMGVPSPIVGEAMSSWVERTAVATRLRTRDVLLAWSIKKPIFWLDAGAISLDLNAISQVSLQPINSLLNFQYPASTILADPYHSCLTTEPLYRRPIYRYCPSCLATDAMPYIRQSWRYAFSYVCSIHSEILRDHCAKCSSRLDLSHKRKVHLHFRQGARSIRYCRYCGADLATAVPQYLPNSSLIWVLARQQELLALVHGTSTSKLRQPESVPPSLCIDDMGRVNLQDQASLNGLLSMLMVPALESQIGLFSRIECTQELRSYLWAPLSGSKQGEKKFFIGLAGARLFGGFATEISEQLTACQSRYGPTIWSKLESMGADDIPRRASREQIERAILWSSTRQNSRS